MEGIHAVGAGVGMETPATEATARFPPGTEYCTRLYFTVSQSVGNAFEMIFTPAVHCL